MTTATSGVPWLQVLELLGYKKKKDFSLEVEKIDTELSVTNSLTR